MSEELSEIELNELLREAGDPATPAARLEAMYHDLEEIPFSGDEASDKAPVETALAGNPNTPPAVLRRLACFLPLAVAQNPALPLLLLIEPNLLHHLSRDAAGALLRSADTPEFVLWALNWERRRDLARAIPQHVRIRGEAGDDWRAEVEREWERLPFRLNPTSRELVELGLAPERLLRALGEGREYAGRRVLLAAATRSREAGEITALLKRASGCDSLRRIRRPGPDVDSECLARLACGGPWAQAIAARHPTAAPGVLAQLAVHPSSTIREFVAGNPSTPAEVLAQLSENPEIRVRLAVARNPGCPLQILTGLAHDREARVRASAARHPHAGVMLLEELAHDPDTVVRIAVLRHPNTPELCRRALEADPGLRAQPGEGQVKRPGRHVPPDGLQARRGPRTRRVGNLLTPVGENALPADHPAFTMPGPAAVPPREPAQLVRWLLDGPSELKRFKAGAEPFELRELLLRQDPHPWQVEARRHIALDVGQSAEVLGILAQHYLPTVRARVAGNPACPLAVLQELAKEDVVQVQSRLAANPRITAEIQVELAKSDELQVAQNLVRNPNLIPELLQQLSGHTLPQVRAEVARHRRCPRELLIRMAGDANRVVRAAVVQAPEFPPEALERMIEPALREAAAEDDPLLRWIALSHPAMPAARLEVAATSPRGLDRLAVALNPTVPDEIREKLKEDGLALVRAAARREG